MFFKRTFPGGVHPSGNKGLTASKPIEDAKIPQTAVILLTQHSGAPCRPLVKVGDPVKVGQKIGGSDQYISSPVHASVSGTVKAIEPRLCFTGTMVEAVVIESDGKMEISDSIKPPQGDLITVVREAGIVGMGGAAFPTSVKLSPPGDRKIEALIINGAECEPFLTCDHRIMLEEADLIADGIRSIKEHLKVKNALIGIEGNKKDAINRLRERVKDAETVELAIKYPQGGERQLIKALTGREVPAGGLPFEVGVVVINVGTCAQIARTLKTGLPLVDRVVTVTGKGLRSPKNLRVRIGTLFSDLIEQCGGAAGGEIKKVIAGGPMMGVAVPSAAVPVVKGTSGILVMTGEESSIPEPWSCIRCAKCVDFCPQYLLPNYLADYSENSRFDKAEKLGARDCIECGACSYVCPTKRHLAQLIKLAKSEISKK